MIVKQLVFETTNLYLLMKFVPNNFLAYILLTCDYHLECRKFCHGSLVFFIADICLCVCVGALLRLGTLNMSVQVAKTIMFSWFYVQMLRSGPDQFRALQQIRFCCVCLFQGTVFVDCRSLFFCFCSLSAQDNSRQLFENFIFWTF